MKIIREIDGMKFEVVLTDDEIEQIHREFIDGKYIRDTRYFLEENYNGEVDEETVASIAEDYKNALGSQVERIEAEVFDEVMESNYPEYERNW